jgi:hypothetical protein
MAGIAQRVRASSRPDVDTRVSRYPAQVTRPCAICRRPDAELDPRELLPGVDLREYRLLDRAVHSACLPRWAYRKQFAAEFRDAARMANRPDLILGTDGAVHEGRRPFRPFAGFKAGLLARLRLITFRGDGTTARLRHYGRVGGIAAILTLALGLAGLGVFFSAVGWPGGTVIGAPLLLVAATIAAHVWRWSPMILSDRPDRPWWS